MGEFPCDLSDHCEFSEEQEVKSFNISNSSGIKQDNFCRNCRRRSVGTSKPTPPIYDTNQRWPPSFLATTCASISWLSIDFTHLFISHGNQIYTVTSIWPYSFHWHRVRWTWRSERCQKQLFPPTETHLETISYFFDLSHLCSNPQFWFIYNIFLGTTFPFKRWVSCNNWFTFTIRIWRVMLRRETQLVNFVDRCSLIIESL